MSVAWDVIRIKHGWGSAIRLDRRDKRLTVDYYKTFKEFEEVDRQVKMYKQQKQQIPPKLALQHRELFEKMENRVHRLIIDEHSELLRDTELPLKTIKSIYRLLDRALQSHEYGAKTKHRIQQVLEAASIVESALEDLASVFMDDARGLLGEARNMDSVRGYTIRDEEGVLAKLQRRDNWKIRADAKLKEYSEAVSNFVKKLESIHQDKKLAAVIGYNFEKIELPNLLKLTTLMVERAKISKNILHYYVNLYHKYQSYQLSPKEELELHKEERRLSILFRKMFGDIESTVKTLRLHRKRLVGKLLSATTGIILALQILASTAMAASPQAADDMRAKAFNYAKTHGHEMITTFGHKMFEVEKNGVRLSISEDGSKLVVEYEVDTKYGPITAFVGDNDDDTHAEKLVVVNSGRNMPSHVRTLANQDALSGNNVESASTGRELISSFSGLNDDPPSSVMFPEVGKVVYPDGSVEDAPNAQSLADRSLNSGLARFTR